MTRSLPEHPSLETLKKQAKILLKSYKQGDPEACGTLRLLDRFSGKSDTEILSASLGLQECQHALAIDYGFKSWAELRKHVLEKTADHKFLHVQCTEAAAGALRASSVPGEVLVWDDPVIEGPMSANWSVDEWREARARYFVDNDLSKTVEGGMQWLAAKDEALAMFRDYAEVVFWFDACLFDQTILIRLLDWFGQQEMGSSRISLICIGHFPGVDKFKGLAQLEPEQMASLLETRHEVSNEEIELATRAWAAYCLMDPSAIEEVVTSDTSALPYLRKALTHHLQRFPSVENGLNLIEKTILREAAKLGPTKLPRFIGHVLTVSGLSFLSDAMVAAHMKDMASGEHPLLDIDNLSALSHPYGKADVTVTQTGRDVLAGKADYIKLNGIDRWLGGVHLQGGEAQWRWNEKNMKLVAKQGHVERAEIARRSISYWGRGWGGTPEETLREVCNDPEWSALIDEQARLTPLSKEAKGIRLAIAEMEPCHESFNDNAERVVAMIGNMRPGMLLDCGQACPARMQMAKQYAKALERWKTGSMTNDPKDKTVWKLLGEPDKRKNILVGHLLKKIADNGYHAGPEKEEDWKTTESLITHLEICCHFWEQSLRITLEEIGTGLRKAQYHCNSGFNACGDAPSQAQRLAKMLDELEAWRKMKPNRSEIGKIIGVQTPEKRWLVGSLCKHIKSQGNMGRIIF